MDDVHYGRDEEMDDDAEEEDEDAEMDYDDETASEDTSNTEEDEEAALEEGIGHETGDSEGGWHDDDEEDDLIEHEDHDGGEDDDDDDDDDDDEGEADDPEVMWEVSSLNVDVVDCSLESRALPSRTVRMLAKTLTLKRTTVRSLINKSCICH